MAKRKRIEKETGESGDEVDRSTRRFDRVEEDNGKRSRKGNEDVRGQARPDRLVGADESGAEESDDETVSSGSASSSEERDDLRAIVRFLEVQETEDLRIPLSTRAHFERLLERLWSIKVSETGAEQTEEQDHLHRRIRDHPAMGSSPYMLRWPLSVETVPQPRWSLADEINALLHTTLRDRPRIVEGETEEEGEVEKEEREQERGDEEREQGGKEEEEDVAGQEADEHGEEPRMPMSVLLPAIARCQASLSVILCDLSRRITRGKGQLSIQRRDILTWRDVMKCIESRPDVHSDVVASTQARLHTIFGSERTVPAAIALSYAGQQNSALNGLLESEDKEALLRKSEIYRPMVDRGKRRTTRTMSERTADELDEDLLLCNSRGRRSRRFLAKAPNQRMAEHSVDE